ncbi:DUF397 domain-containing protein [Streptomyces sp. NPDC058232]|uniref:DUF397 domain-containing protein n=1 Tax=Streptomyces sp. NPDC058232 TaxID=3346393 RepID=UPI0036E854C4
MSVDESGRCANGHAWFKSSHNAGEDGDCVEVAVAWRKSTYSAGDGGQCVEVATCLSTVLVRDSKDIARPGLALAPKVWTACVGFACEV